MVRELLFRRSQVLSVLGERRAFRPYGIKGTDGEFYTFRGGGRPDSSPVTSLDGTLTLQQKIDTGQRTSFKIALI